MIPLSTALPLSLYIHLPWCIKKCPYCDFNAYALAPEKSAEKDYIEALILDLETALPHIWGRTIHSIFIGGGTPSLIAATILNELLSALRSRLNINPNMEITLEANPKTAEADKFYDYYEIGINRLSIGVQSFNPEKLKALGRNHDPDEALNAIALAKQAGFENINIDLMFGLVEQSVTEALTDLEVAIEQDVAHISWYQLTIEPNTVFSARPPPLPNEDCLWDMQTKGQQLLSDSGYKQYEISAYATAKNQCLHNINYWEFGDYLGIGAGAHSKITDIAETKITRFKRHKLPSRYVELAHSGIAITETKTLTSDDLLLEFMMNAMRLKEGVPTDLFMERTGLSFQILDEKLALAVKEGLIDRQQDQLKPTKKGLRYLNNLLEIFID